MIYIDSTALVKLALTEPESGALATWLAERSEHPLVSSALHQAEVFVGQNWGCHRAAP